MKNLLFIFLVFFTLNIFADNTETYQIYDSSNQEVLNLQELADKVSEYDVIFFGEFHDDAVIHKLEYEILPLLWNKNKNLLISMEMFERDVQNVLDDYIKGNIKEKEFLEKTRPWPNYEPDYKPVIEFAKENKINVIAANVPRKYAAMVNKKGTGSLDGLSVEEKSYIAKNINILNDAYKEKFMETMKSMSNSPMAEHMSKMKDNIYAAQCLKDDTMAESMIKYLKEYPNHKIIHFNGDFHSNSHLGTAQKIAILNNKLKICVITPVSWGKDKKFTFPIENKNEGDFLILVLREN